MLTFWGSKFRRKLQWTTVATEKKKPYKCTFSILIIDKILYPYFTGFEPLSDCAFFSRKLFSGAFLFLQTFQELWAKQRVCLLSITYKLLQWVACYICVWGFIIIIFVCFSFENSLHFQERLSKALLLWMFSVLSDLGSSAESGLVSAWIGNFRKGCIESVGVQLFC